VGETWVGVKPPTLSSHFRRMLVRQIGDWMRGHATKPNDIQRTVQHPFELVAQLSCERANILQTGTDMYLHIPLLRNDSTSTILMAIEICPIRGYAVSRSRSIGISVMVKFGPIYAFWQTSRGLRRVVRFQTPISISANASVVKTDARPSVLRNVLVPGLTLQW
jgi:hypothetical protein